MQTTPTPLLSDKITNCKASEYSRCLHCFPHYKKN